MEHGKAHFLSKKIFISVMPVIFFAGVIIAVVLTIYFKNGSIAETSDEMCSYLSLQLEHSLKNLVKNLIPCETFQDLCNGCILRKDFVVSSKYPQENALSCKVWKFPESKEFFETFISRENV